MAGQDCGRRCAPLRAAGWRGGGRGCVGGAAELDCAGCGIKAAPSGPVPSGGPGSQPLPLPPLPAIPIACPASLWSSDAISPSVMCIWSRMPTCTRPATAPYVQPHLFLRLRLYLRLPR